MNKTFGYARVSTKEQHLDRQIQALREAGVEERDIITDKASGASLDRPGYQTLKNSMLREGDTLVIKSLDRLSRNKEHITQELRYFKEHHIQVRVLDLPTTMIELPEGQEWVFQMINNTENILKGKVICGCCGRKMQRKRGTNHADWYFLPATQTTVWEQENAQGCMCVKKISSVQSITSSNYTYKSTLFPACSIRKKWHNLKRN